MKMPNRLLAAACLALTAACASGARGPVPQVRLGDTFRLSVGQTAVIAGQPLTVRFVTVLEDSRCPLGVQCVRAGEGKIQVSLHAADRDPSVVVLSTDPPSPQSASYGEYDITLVALDPRPGHVATAPIYVATLRVTGPGGVSKQQRPRR